MRKEWYVIQAYSGMENKVKDLIEEKVRLLGLTGLFGRIIVPEVEELNYSSESIERIFVSSEAEILVKSGKEIKKGDQVAKEPPVLIKKSGTVKEVKTFKRITIETKDKKYSKSFLIPDSLQLISGLRAGKAVTHGFQFVKEARYECDVDGEIGAIDKVKRVIVDINSDEHDVYIIPFKAYDSKAFKAGNFVQQGQKIAESMEYKSKTSGKIEVRDHITKKEVRVIKTSKTKLFPGYIFIEMVHVKESEKLVTSLPYVSTFLNVGGKPVKLKKEEISSLLKLVGQEYHERPSKNKRIRLDYAIGEIVKVINGPFESFTGKVIAIDPEKQEVKVVVTLFGRETTVGLGLDEVEKIV